MAVIGDSMLVRPRSPEALRAVVENVRRAATARGRQQLGAFAAEGARLFRRGLRAGWAPRQVLVAESIVASGKQADVELIELIEQAGEGLAVPDAALLDLAGGRSSGKVSALFELPQPLTLVEALKEERARGKGEGKKPPALIVALVDIQEPGNVGALRTGLASGATLAVAVGCSDPFHPKAVRTSLGSVFKLPLARAENAASLLDELKACAIHSVAAVSRGGDVLHQARFPDAGKALLVGNEGAGLDPETCHRADQRVTIDLSDQVDSYCVNAAAAVCLFELRRRQLSS